MGTNLYPENLFWLRGQDSNLRPHGYEPCELPLLHPAISVYAEHAGSAKSLYNYTKQGQPCQCVRPTTQ